MSKLYGIRDNRQWVSMDGKTLTNRSGDALKFEKFEEAWEYMRHHFPMYFCAVQIYS